MPVMAVFAIAQNPRSCRWSRQPRCKWIAAAEARHYAGACGMQAVPADNEMEFVCRSNRLGLVGLVSTTTES